MEWLLQPETWIAFITLVVLELVLGVDNVIFISILAGKLPEHQQQRARTTGILAAVITRLLLLLSLKWLIGLEEPLFTIWNQGFSGRNLILLAGGLFLLWKSTHEIHQKLEGVEGQASAKVTAAFWSVVIQIMLLDIVFSLDSVITAIGMVDRLEIMIAAVIIAAVVMVFTSGPLGNFVERHPTIKMLALSFLLLIGFTLVFEGFNGHIPKGYVYFAMGFSVMVEMLNLRMARRGVVVRPVNLRDAYKASELAAVAVPVPVEVEASPIRVSARKTPTAKKGPTKKSTGKKQKTK